MATQWVLDKVSDALAPTVAGACATAGSFASGAMNYVGSSISGVGDSIGSSIRAYGDGAKDYGNSIMDWTAASGSRAQTASNPLGLSTSIAGGKAKAANPSIYRAPPAAKKEAIKAKPAQKKIIETPKVAGTGVATKPRAKIGSTKNSPMKASSIPAKVSPASNAGNLPKPKPGAVPLKSTASRKPATMSTAKAKATPGTSSAANPLGLKY